MIRSRSHKWTIGCSHNIGEEGSMVRSNYNYAMVTMPFCVLLLYERVYQRKLRARYISGVTLVLGSWTSEGSFWAFQSTCCVTGRRVLPRGTARLVSWTLPSSELFSCIRLRLTTIIDLNKYNIDKESIFCTLVVCVSVCPQN